MALRYQQAVAALLIALATSAIVSLPALDIIRGISLDALTAVRWTAFGRNHDLESSPVVVVGLDEETYRTPPFAGTPILTWTREIGLVLSEIIEGGAKVVGFDLVFPISLEQSSIQIGDETLGQRVRGFDREFLRALAAAARDDKLVLGEIQETNKPVRPSPGQRIAVGQQRNIRVLNVFTDPDDVVRRLPLFLTVDGKPSPSMALELASRAQRAEPKRDANGVTTLAGYRIPMAVRNTVTLNFEGGAADVPTFSLVDLHGCAMQGNKDFFRRHFGGKVVLFGTLLDVEDRITTSKRFATVPEEGATTRCTGAAAPTRNQFKRNSVSGVFVHATGVSNLIRHDAVRQLGRRGGAIAFFIVALLAAACGLMLAPAGALFAVLGGTITGTFAAVLAFRHAIALPLVDSGLAAFLALGATMAYRFTIADKDTRILRRNFALYLAPKVIDSMLKSDRLPALGGEVRNVTVFFSDVAGFSRMSEQLTPRELVLTMNEYLSAMSDLIEAEGGLIDKYIGDAIVAVFGAPLDDPLHAQHAVTAALNCQRRLKKLNNSSKRLKRHQIRQRIGLSSGEALVGNIGSRRRFNYTAMGDVVNLASRLEGANRKFGTSIMASESTMALARETFLWRELDTIRVKGKDNAIAIYEPLAKSGQESPEQCELVAAYADGLRLWRARAFDEAAKSFGKLASRDACSTLFLERVNELTLHPPGPDWEAILTLDEK